MPYPDDTTQPPTRPRHERAWLTKCISRTLKGPTAGYSQILLYSIPLSDPEGKSR